MSPGSPSRMLLILVITGGILAVSTASIFITFAQAYAPSLVIAAYRLTIASVVLAPVAATRNRDDLRQLPRHNWRLALLSGIFLALHFASWISSLQFTSVASSVVLVTTTPLWVALLSPLFLHERISKATIIGLILALAGGVFVGISDSCSWSHGLHCPSLGNFVHGRAFLGNFLALFGAWMAAGYLLVGRRLRTGMRLIPYIFVVYGMAAIVEVGIVLIARLPVFGYPPQAYFWMILLALVPQLIGHSTFNWALGFLPASFVSVTLLGEPIGSIILAYFILGQAPGTLSLLGCALILTGIFVVARQASGSKDSS